MKEREVKGQEIDRGGRESKGKDRKEGNGTVYIYVYMSMCV
jgi:hypothetical protein